MLRIVVCVKPVPDPKSWYRVECDSKTKTLMREGITSVINPLDRNALEAALQLREKQGGDITVLSMAPESAIAVLKESLAMGADRSILLADKAFAGADTLATAYVLSEALKKMRPFDVLLCGNETIDGGTAQVSAQIAEFLAIPNVMHVSAIEVRGGLVFLVRSNLDSGYMVVEVKPPMVLSVVKEINKPRHITFTNIMKAESKSVQIWSSKDLSLKEPWVGLAGSPTQMTNLTEFQRERKAEMLPGGPEEKAKALADRLHRLGFC